MSEVIIAFPRNNEMVQLRTKTLSGCFSCINTRVGFDSEIHLPNLKQSDCEKISIDKSFQAFKRSDLKVIYRLKIKGEDDYSNRRIIRKVLNFDKNNQYGYALTRDWQ